ncbi:O-antigen ligase domain-containing protein [Actinopolyspora erythraea]|uniref:O-antigen ligase domain-containing protein n=1 Tax=Actinopolyspora erythraea TaxID=414996 RepID=A0A223RQL3_9ACTN|nr:O-antigen ligase family protein [Actinopolyspora erythraea]ASU78154.1 O-antigen ligase domain-containing protein [Actinopolyspora erythraea]
MLDYRHFLADAPGSRSDRDTWRLVACALAFIVASEYEFRIRDEDQSISGNPDFFVLLEIVTYGVVACWLFLRFRPAPRLTTAHWTTLAAYGYVATLFLSTLYSPYFEMALVRSCQMAIILALTRSTARHSNRASMHCFAHAYSALITGSVIFGVLVPFPRRESQPDRFTWLYLHPVAAGQLLAIAVIVLASYVIGRRNTRIGPRWPLGIYLGMLAVCAGGLVATNTRGAALAAAVGSVAALWIRWRGARRLEITAFLSVGALAAVLAAAPAIAGFFTRGHSMSRLMTLNARTELWSHALEAFAQRPLYGHGQSATRGLFLDAMGLGGGHNAVINLLVNSGVLGLIAWSALVLGIFVNSARAKRLTPEPRVDRTIIISVSLGMLANSVFTEALGAPANAAAVWLLMLAAWASMLRDETYGANRTVSTAGR